MIQKKICLLGAFAVGKTSLVSRFVHSIFSDKYHTTVGVKIDKKVLGVGETELNLILWDLHGEDDFQEVRASYLRGMSGYLLVVDGTRRASVDTAIALQQRAHETVGPVPFEVLVNKADLRPDWEVTEDDLADFGTRGWSVLETSAKTGDGVENAFANLAGRLLAG